MSILAKQVDKLIANLFRVDAYTIPAAGAGFSNNALDTAIISILTGIGTPLGGNLGGLANPDGGDNTTSGVACAFDYALEIRATSTQDPLKDTVSDSEVSVVTSRRYYASGLSTVAGIAIDFASQGCPNTSTNTIIKFDDADDTIKFTTDGTTYGTGVSVAGHTDDEVFFLKNDGATAYITIRVTNATTLAALAGGGDKTDIITFNKDRFACGLVSWNSGVRVPYYNPTASLSVDFLIPVVLHWSQLTPEKMLIDQGVGYLDIVSSPDELEVVENIEGTLISSPPTSTTCTSTYNIRAASKMLVFVNGQCLDYGTEFTAAGRTITFNETAIGYLLAGSDKIVAKYWRI